MNKKIPYFLLICLLLTGCKGKKKDSGGTDPAEDNITTIQFLSMVNKNYLPKLQSMVDSFMKENPTIKVNLSNPLGSGNYTMLEKNVVAGFFKGDYPDLVQCYPDNVVKYMNRGYALRLDDYLNNEEYGIIKEDKTDYVRSFLNEGASYAREGYYSLPFCKSTELMYYNADALIGLDLSNIDSSINDGNPLDEQYLDNLTWEDLFEHLCPAIKQYNDVLDDEDKLYVPSDSSAVFTYDSDENFFITLANQYGYDYTSVDAEGKGSIDFDNPEMIELVKTLKKAKDNGFLQTKGTYKDYVSYLFQDRKTLFTISSTAGLTYNFPKDDVFSVGVAKIPHAEGKEYVSINQGPSLCILDHKDEDRALASYLLWKYITNETNTLDWTELTNYMVLRDSVYHSDAYMKMMEITEESSKRDISKAHNLMKISEIREKTFNTFVFKGSSNARSNVGSLLIDCLNSEDIDNEINDLFKQYSDEAKGHL